MKRPFLILGIIVCIVIDTNAQVINVPADQTSIQAAIDAASNGDSVIVAHGTYYENINFMGKAITVASQFILDGDTSHISETIIDGSQSTNPDTASVVTMWTGEDTTSVLMGFTITGGNGTLVNWPDETSYMGSGVLISGNGGKVVNNTIEENHADNRQGNRWIYGGIIHANVDNNHSAIFRENVIRSNSATGTEIDGGAIFLNGGRIILESNHILNNTMNGTNTYGAGIFIHNMFNSEVIEELVIRNNLISGNSGTSSGDSKCNGGAILIASAYEEGMVEIYNNIITENSVDGGGGGISHYFTPVAIYNNTLYNNSAALGGNNLETGEGKMILFNNIIGSDDDFTGTDIALWDVTKGPVLAYYNVIKEPLNSEQQVRSVGNIIGNPVFESDSYQLVYLSPGIGQGKDTVKIDDSIYLAPLSDYNGNARPHPIDNRVDMGAVESSYEGFVNIPDANFLNALINEGVDTNGDGLISFDEAEVVTTISLYDPMLSLGCGRDRLHSIKDLAGIEAFINLEELNCLCGELTTIDLSRNLKLETLVCYGNLLTSLDVSKNSQLRALNCSHSLQNRPKLSSLDVTNNPLLTYLDCSGNQLTSLDISKNTSLEILSCEDNDLTNLDVSNNPSLGYLNCGGNQLSTLDLSNVILKDEYLCPMSGYLTWVDDCNNYTLAISNMPTLSEVCVWYNFNIDSINVDSTDSPNVFFTDCDAPDIIEFDIDILYQPEFIEVTSTEDGWIYLVPEDTKRVIEDIRRVSIDSAKVVANTAENLFLSGLENGAYWIYARNEAGNISDPVAFSIQGVGIENIFADQIRIYPNPTNDIITIKTGSSDQYSIEIASLNGLLISSLEMAGSTQQIDLSSFQKGIYFITLRSKDFVARRKILKL